MKPWWLSYWCVLDVGTCCKFKWVCRQHDVALDRQYDRVMAEDAALDPLCEHFRR